MNWTEKDNALHRLITTADFGMAHRIASAIAAPCEVLKRYPEVELGPTYVRIRIGMTQSRRPNDAQELAAMIETAIKPFLL